MSEFIFISAGFFHKYCKKALHKGSRPKINFASASYIQKNNLLGNINEFTYSKPPVKSELFPIDNVLSSTDQSEVTGCSKMSSRPIKSNEDLSIEKLLGFIEAGQIPSGYRNEGFYYAGYSLTKNSWILPSWIWTNAILVESYINCDKLDKAVKLGELFLNCQEESGGWIVRHDFDNGECTPCLAPNDSSYIANHCMMSLFAVTGDLRYLKSAERCAEWVMSVSMKSNSMPKYSYNPQKMEWDSRRNIIDVGFTSALFTRLFEQTNDRKYVDYANSFTKDFLSIFHLGSGILATNFSENDRLTFKHNTSGLFARGYAWALEGLISVYKVNPSEDLKADIDLIINVLIRSQQKSGGWLYNMKRSLNGVFSGFDCKGIPIIAYHLYEWYCITDNTNCLKAAKKAVSWCEKHSYVLNSTGNAICLGAYSFEGAIVNDFYSSVPFLYANSYLILLMNKMKNNGE